MNSTDALPALDQTERVILRAAEEEGGTGCPCDLLVVGDTTGALTAAALELVTDHPDARVHSWSASRAETAALAERLPQALSLGRLVLPTGTDPVPLEEFAGGAEAHLVLARLPKSLAGLDDLARRVAVLAASSGREDLTLIAGGRVKHMSRSQNDVLASVFGEVHASRGLGKSRALVASAPRPETTLPAPATGTATVAVRGERRELGLRGIGDVFGGARADAGSLLLLGALDAALVAGELAVGGVPGGAAEATSAAGATAGGTSSAIARAVDVGCGNGLLTAYLSAALPDAAVLGSDDDADAVAATRATLAASGLARDDVEVTWDVSLSLAADASADLLLLNPPFHDGTAVDATLVQDLLDASARVLRPGGQLWFVHNSHLRYRPEVERRVGPVRERARDRRFTVLSATR
ncbi:class I SAM-dependent methyltransferase [Brachybacterium sp. J153]|uniref:class I SAM-dependent methyltransferase n=1 Tax=Brachybacterium sp. J153 TaxID=3116488 RepID=UPI002E766F86|nr:methyltransferase [Brachybacterium sp. J153]MEE1618239.1 methyltransferase [Brachybacterium sp. J153]